LTHRAAFAFVYPCSYPKTGFHFSGSCLFRLGMTLSENRLPLFGVMP
jgi:hypothetical protein